MALAQIAVRQTWDLPPPWGPMVGDTLPFVPVTILEDGEPANVTSLVAASERCDVVFLMSVYCSHCARMRGTWADDFRLWTDSVGASVNAIWILPQDAAVAVRFMDGFDVVGATVAVLSGHVERSWRQLGVVGTPLAYLVDGSGRVQASVLGPRFPAASLASAVCGSGRD